jgi:hypothetical protein
MWCDANTEQALCDEIAQIAASAGSKRGHPVAGNRNRFEFLPDRTLAPARFRFAERFSPV